MALVLKRSDIVIDQTHRQFEDTDYAQAEFKINGVYLTPTQVEEIHKRHTRFVRGNPRVDVTAINLELFRKRVTSWEGIEFDDGPAECTDANKDRVFNEFNGLADRILRAIDEESEKIAKRRDAEAKN